MIKNALMTVGLIKTPKRTLFLTNPLKATAALATWKTAKVVGTAAAVPLAIWGGKKILDKATTSESFQANA